jgi:hypothetical protein
MKLSDSREKIVHTYNVERDWRVANEQTLKIVPQLSS